MGFFGNLFGRKVTEVRYEDIEKMPYEELRSYMVQTVEAKKTGPMRQLTAFQRRLFEIALWNNHVPAEHRNEALRLAESLTVDIEAAAADNPQFLEAVREATKFMVGHAPYGRLFWLIEENKVPSDQTPSFIVRPEHSHLVRGYFEDTSGAPPEAIHDLKRDLLLELISDRRPAQTKNAVLILHGLALAREATLEALLEDPELAVFRNAHKDYNSARRTLVDLGVIPNEVRGMSFDPAPKVEDLADLIVLDTQAALKGDNDDADQKAYLDGLGESEKSGFHLARTILTLHLAVAQSTAVHGESFGKDLRNILLGKFPAMHKAGLEPLWTYLDLVEQKTYDENGFSPDLLWVDRTRHEDDEEGRNEETFQAELASLERAAAFLSAYRTSFLEYFRYRLRYFAAGTRGESADRDPVDYWDDWVLRAS